MCFRPTHGVYSGQRPYDLAQDATKQIYHVFFFEQIAVGNIDNIQQLIDGGLPAVTSSPLHSIADLTAACEPSFPGSAGWIQT